MQNLAEPLSATRSDNPFRDAATNYAKRGWLVFPSHIVDPDGACSCPKGKECGRNAGKHPRIVDWTSDATAEVRTIHRWMFRFGPSNISIATGIGSGLVVIDVDKRHQGDVGLCILEESLGKLPPTVKVRTGSGGWHLYFRHPGGDTIMSRTNVGISISQQATGIDIRADGGQAIAPPSVHYSGGEYTWEIAPDDAAPAELPPAWINFLRSAPPVMKPERPASANTTTSSGTPMPTSPSPVAANTADLDTIASGCAWMMHCKDDAAILPEPEWYAMLGIVGRTKDGEASAHAWSKPHPEYDEAKTAAKLTEALKHGPRTCANIRAACGGESYCSACSHAGRIRTPLQLGHVLPAGFVIAGGALLYRPDPEKPGDRVSDAITVEAMTRDDTSSTWGRLLSWLDADGRAHSYIMPAESFADQPGAAVKPLLRDGLRVDNPKMLTIFIQHSVPAQRLRIVSRAGWHGDAYLLPSGELIAPAGRDEDVRLESSHRTAAATVAGTLASWQSDVASLCVSNSRLLLSVSTAFAAYLLRIAGEESGGFHLRGPNSKGKSKCLMAAASVGGMTVASWKATTNGLEGQAAKHHDGVLCLDELGLCDPREAGEAAYLLANGQGKARMNKDAKLRDGQSWSLLFVSSGEVSLAEHMLAGDRKARAGMEARMPDIPALVPGGFGVFESIHSSPDGDLFARRLDACMVANHGTAGPAFLHHLVDDLSRARAFIAKQRATFMARNVLPGADGQVSRVAGRFALVAAAGELARHYGVVPWPKWAAFEGVETCFDAWLKERGGTDMAEDSKVVAQVREFIERHGDGRFVRVGGKNKLRVLNRAGYVREVGGVDWFCIQSEVWKNEVCKGYRPRDVVDALRKLGLIKVDKDRKAPTTERIPDSGAVTMKLYVVSGAILGLA